VKTVLIIDDEAAIRSTFEQILSYEKYNVLTAGDGPSALTVMSENQVDAVFLDIKMPGMDGFEVLAKINELQYGMPVIVISGHGDIETAVEAVKSGAYDFLEKPLDRSRLLLTLKNGIEFNAIQEDRNRLRKGSGYNTPLVGQSAPMQAVQKFINQVAPTDSTVLLTGENGTGKELVVKAIHAGSKRCANPLVEVNCAAIPSELVESELFGHEKGSFTGAEKMRIGKFEQADGGTLFLDEIGDMSYEAQAKVLKAVEESKFERVGSNEVRYVDVRIIAATNRDLSDPETGFRQDLFFRLNVLAIELPPLRSRDGDIKLLLDYFMETTSQSMKIESKQFTPKAYQLLEAHSWPGNVRELRNIVERLLILTPGPAIDAKDIPPLSGVPFHDDSSFSNIIDADLFVDFKEQSEAIYLQHKLKENRYNISKTAEKLGMQRSNLYKKINKYELETEPTV
jgi:two-component system, NtrC family, nitrogen regulation response regulator NtrX